MGLPWLFSVVCLTSPDLAEIRFRGERRLGELMAAQKPHMSVGGRPSAETGFNDNPVSAPITLAEAGIDKNLADRPP